MPLAEFIDLTLLPIGVIPTNRKLLKFEEVKAYRNMECGYYTCCLKFASRAKWESFQCTNCPFKENVLQSCINL